ncbi:MAG TPA: hypothetical protein VI072_16225 [Polyangiaceae bacterium]
MVDDSRADPKPWPGIDRPEGRDGTKQQEAMNSVRLSASPSPHSTHDGRDWEAHIEKLR